MINPILSLQIVVVYIFMINIHVSYAQNLPGAIQATPYCLKVSGFDLSFKDCAETNSGDVIFIGRFDKGRTEVFDSVYRVGKEMFPDWVDIDTSLYRDSFPVRILVHKVTSSGEPLWTRLYDFGYSGIKVDIDSDGFLYVLANSKHNDFICPVVAKINDAGEIIWVTKLGINHRSLGFDIAVSDKNDVGVLASSPYYRTEIQGQPVDTTKTNYPIANSRFILLNNQTGDVLSDTSIELNNEAIFNYPKELKSLKNSFYAHISTASYMSTWSQLVKIDEDGTFGKFNRTDFVATSMYGEPKFELTKEGNFYIVGKVSTQYYDHEILILDNNMTKKTQKRVNFYGPHSNSYPVPLDEGVLVVGYEDYANRITKYSKSLNQIWSLVYYDSLEDGILFPEKKHETGIVINGVLPSKDGGCFIFGRKESGTYEDYATVYVVDKNGKMIW